MVVLTSVSPLSYFVVVCQYPKMPIFSFLSKKKKSEKKKENMNIPLLDVATFSPKLPRCSTPISSIPEVNFLTLCDISEISMPEEDPTHRFSDVTPIIDFSIHRSESSLRLEKMASLIKEMRLEHLYDEREDWFNDNHLDSLEFSSRELSLRLRF